MAIAVLADHDHGQLSKGVARLVGGLAPLGLPIDIVVAGKGVSEIAQQAAGLEGVRAVRVADAALYASQSAEALTALLQSVSDEYSHFAALAGAVGKDVIPRLAAKLDVMPVTDVIAVHGATRFDRPIYAGNAIETVSTTEPKVLLTLRASAFDPAPSGGRAAVTALAPAATPERAAEFLVAHRTKSDAPDLSTAQIVVAGGVSLGSTHKFEMIEELASVLGAAVGATRAAVDAGYAPNEWQVGQTGKVIAPDLYIAIGISGALQHLSGIQGAKKIIAINSDPEAPLMKIADITLVGDLLEIVPRLTAALRKRASNL